MDWGRGVGGRMPYSPTVLLNFPTPFLSYSLRFSGIKREKKE
jgi:hypothetical protein